MSEGVLGQVESILEDGCLYFWAGLQSSKGLAENRVSAGQRIKM